jgi:Domain of unknown function (DUF4145)
LILTVDSSSTTNTATSISICCPNCHRQGTFEAIGVNDLFEPNARALFGQRRCPNPACHTHIFFVTKEGKLLVTYPTEKIDFDTVNLPSGVISTFEEAISCHANQCYVAGAIMVRKTLEELCRDRTAQGGNLKERIRALGAKVVLPKELLDGLDDLRLLGNDAAHIESQEYDKIGKEEVEVGIEFTKEVLKAVYQYSALLARLRGLKKSP